MEFTQEQVQKILANHYVVIADIEEVLCACGRVFSDSKSHGNHFMAELVLLWTRDV